MSVPLSGAAQNYVDVGVGLVGDESRPADMRVSPSLHVLRSAGFLTMDASIGDFTRRARLQSATLDAGIRSPSLGPLRFSLDANAVNDSSKGFSPRAEAGAAASIRFGNLGGYSRASRDVGGQTGVHFGAWKAFRTAIVSVFRSYSDHRLAIGGGRTNEELFASTQTLGDTIVPPSSGSNSEKEMGEQRSWSETQGRLEMSGGRFLVAAAFGMRGSVASDTARSSMKWGKLTLTTRINSMFSVIAGGGWIPVSARPLARASRIVELGVRFSPGLLLREPAHIAIRPVATSFTVVASSESGYRVRFTVPGARTVEVSGDFNQWQAIPLAEVSPHVWQATLPLQPGVHRVSVRVNGENWMAPPGIASVEDEFTGNRVGILVVK
jgi:hypothetical protein